MIRNMRRRVGFTLMETVFAMGMLTLIVSMLAFVMSRVMAANALSANQLEGTMMLHRLGEQFRRDVHAARTASIEKHAEQPMRLRIELGASSVEYEITSDGVMRTVTIDGQVRSRDPFEMTGVQVLGWNDDFAQSRELVMQLGRLADADAHGGALRHKFSIRARFGSDKPATEGQQ